MKMQIQPLLAFTAVVAVAAASWAQAPVTSPLGALGRTNAAVSAVDSAQSDAAGLSGGGEVSTPGPSPPRGDDAEGGDDARGLSYDPEGRRDPFRPLTGEAADTEERKKHEGTLKGRLLSEVKLTSILQHPAGNIATFEGGPKKEGYFARVGDELWDAQVVRVDYDNRTVVVRQKVDDPRSIKAWRDIAIPLWSDEEKKAEGSSAP